MQTRVASTETKGALYMTVGDEFSNCKGNSRFSSREAVNAIKVII
jgi:hypothetical protein